MPTLRELLDALDTAVAELVDAPAGDAVAIGSVALVDGADLAADAERDFAMPDLYLHAGVSVGDATRWFDGLAHRPPGHRPRAVMSKSAGGSRAVRGAAHRAGVALVAVHPQARWDHILPLVHRVLRRDRVEAPDSAGVETDLFGLAQTVAQNTGGLVSIEDTHSHVLAYSTSDATADELRTLSILGREGPRGYLRALERWGVFDGLRRGDDVIDVPAHPELGTKRRLAVGILRHGEDQAGPRYLGAIWVQQADRPFSSGAEDVLRGAAAIAARMIARAVDAPSADMLLIQRLFGTREPAVDVASVADRFDLPAGGPCAVLGLAGAPSVAVPGGLIRLHASAFRRDALCAVVGERCYVLLPRYPAERVVAAWTRQLVARIEAEHGAVLRAAIALPVADLARVADARVEVDRVLDSPGQARVSTLAESRTAVLLGELLGVLAARPELRDPRLDALDAYDRDHDAQLERTAEVYLAAHGDVRAAAAALQVHPNTLRYRIRRVETIVGVDLADPDDRLLVELQLALRRRTVPRAH